MYYSTDNYIALAYVEVLFERFSELKNKYLDLDIMRNGINALIRELHRDVADMSLYAHYYEYLRKSSDLSWYEAPFEEEKRALKESLDSLKPVIEAVDYLFLKASLSDDDEESKFLLRLAQTMNPDDVLLYLLINTVYTLSEFNEQGMSRVIKECPMQPRKGKIRDLFDITTLIVDFKTTPEKLSPKHLQSLINRGLLFAPLLKTLVNEKMDTMEPAKLQELLIELKFSNPAMRIQFELIKCQLWYKTGAFSQALAFLETNDIDFYRLDEGGQLDYQVLLAKLYEQDGQHGKALLIWQSVIDNESYRSSCYNSYFEAMVRLALFYARRGQIAEAIKIIYINGRIGVTVVIDFFRPEYYVLRGEICLAEKKRDKAVRMYRKALAISEDKKLREKVALVEMDLL